MFVPSLLLLSKMNLKKTRRTKIYALKVFITACIVWKKKKQTKCSTTGGGGGLHYIGSMKWKVMVFKKNS